ncbi:MAG: phosphotransferase [Dehalococcoidia bacterium]
MLSIPLRDTDITPAWLAAALRLGNVDCPAIESVSAEPMTSLTSTMHRLRVVYSRADSSAPRTLIWKQSAVDPAVRAAYGHYRGSAYEREVRFYGEIAPTTSVHVPRCYVARYDAETDEHVLLLEDLAATHEPGDLIGDVGADSVALCLGELALFHAARGGEPAPLNAARRREGQRYFRDCLAKCRPFLSEIVGGELLARLEVFEGLLMPWATQLGTRPLTLIHADVHPGNVLFPMGGAGRAALVDWQGWREGPPARDVGRAVVLLMSVEDRRHSERDLVAQYCSVLRENGAECDEDEAFADYRIGAALQWNWAVTFACRREAWDDATRNAMPGLIRKAAIAALDAVT